MLHRPPFFPLPSPRRAGDKQLAILCHVPKALQEEAKAQFNIKEWVTAVVESCGATIVSETDELVKVGGRGVHTQVWRGCPTTA